MSTASTTARRRPIRMPFPAAGRAHHARDRGDGGRGRLGTVARRHAHQARRRQDRHAGRHRHDHHLRHPAQTRWPPSTGANARPIFKPSAAPVRGYKSWIAGQLEPAGRLTVDDGAVSALKSGQVAAAGRRDALSPGLLARRHGGHHGPQGPRDRQRARRLRPCRCLRIAGLRSSDVEAVLGYQPRSAMIHRDDLVMHKD
jgi:hypothetical protein